MKTIILIVILALSSLMAKDSQLFFIGKYDLTPSEGIYLRWDMIDGNFPEAGDIILKRDGVEILRFQANSIMDKKSIIDIYTPQNQRQNLYRLIDKLSKLQEDNCQNINLSNYADKIGECAKSSFWRYSATKADFNIARILYRGYLDEAVNKINKNSFHYELLATNGTKSIILGKIDVTKKIQRAPKALSFQQLYKRDCNAPEYALDDYTVFLSWIDSKKQDSVINSFFLSGYDIYRTKENVVDANSSQYDLDIATMAESLPYDSSGEIIFPNLEKVNSSLITIPNDTNNTILFQETKDKLKEAGLHPSDKRYYYLVPQDFSGNYGETAKLLVTIPNLLPPPAPWDAKVIEHINFDDGNNSAELVWSNVNKTNYMNHYKNSKKFCNPNATEKERLIFVEPQESCDNAIMEVNLDVKEYEVYRFDSPNEITTFQYNNCSDTKESHYIATVKATSDDMVSFVDKTAQLAKMYWYLLVSKSNADIASVPSAPVLAMIPDRTLPKKPNAKLVSCYDHYVSYTNSSDITDHTNSVAKAKLSCNGKTFYGDLNTINQKRDQCQQSPGDLTLYDKNGFILMVIHFNEGLTNGYDIVKECKDKDLQYGDIVTHWPKIKFSESEKKCVEVSANYGGERFKVKKICGVTTQIDTKDLDLANLGSGEKFCLAVNVFNKNNQYSPTKFLPCFGVVDTKQPNRPNITDIQIEDGKVNIGWTNPVENIASVLVQIYNKNDENKVYTKILPVEKNTLNQATFQVQINNDETWCAKAKSIGVNKKLSQWSGIKCTTNFANKTYLHWPRTKKAIQNKDLNITMKQGTIYIKLGSSISDSCNADSYCKGEVLNKIFKRFSHFSIYRQSIYNDTNSSFIQITPLVENLECPEDTMYSNNGQCGDIEIRISNLSASESLIEFYFMDSYPYITGENYLYEVIYFDPQTSEPKSFSLTAPRVLHTF